MDETTGMILDFISEHHLDVSENDDFITCRICYDEDKNERTIAPCNCVGSHAHVHVSCLEHWLSVSESSKCDICKYTYKTFERHLSFDECLKQKTKFWKFILHFSLMLIILFLWVAIVLICVLRTIWFFIDDTDTDSWCNGLAMTIITFGMTILLWFWCLNCYMFWKMWRHANKIICLDQNSPNENDDDMNTMTQV